VRIYEEAIARGDDGGGAGSFRLVMLLLSVRIKSWPISNHVILSSNSYPLAARLQAGVTGSNQKSWYTKALLQREAREVKCGDVPDVIRVPADDEAS
jgi:hypothetical protein